MIAGIGSIDLMEERTKLNSLWGLETIFLILFE
jgi:hypothetical protein